MITLDHPRAHRDIKLKPCPKCGEVAVLVHVDDGYFAKCTCCETMLARQISVITENIIPFETKEEAIAEWNERLLVRNSYAGGRAIPQEVIEARDERVNLIVKYLKSRGGWITAKEIASEIGMSQKTTENTLQYMKRVFPDKLKANQHYGHKWESEE